MHLIGFVLEMKIKQKKEKIENVKYYLGTVSGGPLKVYINFPIICCYEKCLLTNYEWELMHTTWNSYWSFTTNVNPVKP